MADVMSTTDYVLNSDEAEVLLKVVRELREAGASPIESEFYFRFPDCRELLPEGLHRFLREFRDHGADATCQVRGFPVDEAAVGPTPSHWERPGGCTSTVESDIYMAMCALALGEPFCWATLQYGRLIQDVFPIRGDEKRESGHGSEAFLTFHTDDAFRPDCCDYLMLFGVRNRDRVRTYVSSVRDVVLSSRDRALLLGERFYIVPDDEHIRQLELRAPGDPALQRAIEMRDRPRPVSVLFGDPRAPYIRLDVPFMRCIGDDPQTRSALAALHAELERVRRPLAVEPGMLLILNNRIAVHARDSFIARYDGTDRWLRKIIASRRPERSATNIKPPERIRL
jgi:L-asparagine oxygenase